MSSTWGNASANESAHKDKRAKIDHSTDEAGASKLAPIDPTVLTPDNVTALAKSYQVPEIIFQEN